MCVFCLNAAFKILNFLFSITWGKLHYVCRILFYNQEISIRFSTRKKVARLRYLYSIFWLIILENFYYTFLLFSFNKFCNIFYSSYPRKYKSESKLLFILWNISNTKRSWSFLSDWRFISLNCSTIAKYITYNVKHSYI